MNILVVVAHLDDETFGMGGSLIELSKEHNVKILSLCVGRDQHNSKLRLDTYHKLGKEIGYETSVGKFYDLTLYSASPAKISDIINKEIKSYNANIVYTTSANDIHTEHQMISNCVRVAVRGTTVKKLYEMFIPGSSNTNDFKMNKFIEINLNKKIENVRKYNTEVNENIIGNMESFHKYIGYNNHTIPAEAFNVVFEK